jgi:alpha-glucosidase
MFVLSVGVLIAAGGIAAAAPAVGEQAFVQSPNGNVRAELRVAKDVGQVQFSVSWKGWPIVERSAIDVRLAEGAIAVGASIVAVSLKDVDTTTELPWGKSRTIRNHFRGKTVRLKGNRGLVWDVELRAYDDAFALRYGFPEQKTHRRIEIEDENIEFRLGGDPTVLFTTCDSFTTSHEALYDRKALSEVPAEKLLDKPLLAVWSGAAAAITEAGLRGFAGMYLERVEEAKRNVLRSRLSPRPDRPGTLVEAETPRWSPWRVVMLADEAGQLVENNVLLCLNEPPDVDYSWLRPGKTTFHWWNGTVENGPPSTPETNFAIHKKYIDFCARHNIAYHTVISVAGNLPWFVQSEPGFQDLPHSDTDILTPRPDIDLHRILDYAKQKGVGIRFWVHWKPLSEHLEEAFAQYERWGIRGLMIDFMDRDDQEMVEWQEQCLRAAAAHKLHIQFHGSYKPTGEQRTFPNLFNREGVLNLEYLKWSDLCAPPHAVNVAFTRLLAGPVDYHLGGFRAKRRDEFEPRDLRPFVMGTRGNQLALYVIFENPMPMVADDPTSYEGQPGFDFIVDVPTTWDETKFIVGEAGQYIVLARRSGDVWYLGGITNWTPRRIAIPLTFLGEGEYAATLYLDQISDGNDLNAVRMEKRSVTAAGSLSVALAAGGGVAAVFRSK